MSRSRSDIAKTIATGRDSIRRAIADLVADEQALEDIDRAMRAGRLPQAQADQMVATVMLHASLPNSLRLIGEGLKSNLAGFDYEERQPGEEG